ncbi:MAG TPA: hypothetical protein PLM33_14305, partial [Acidobacteriota bacterium]|nr:hypothetical protein [Acidobacteriota bacterium]
MKISLRFHHVLCCLVFVFVAALSPAFVGAQHPEESFLSEVRTGLPDPGDLCFPTDLTRWNLLSSDGAATLTSVVPIGRPFSQAVRI